MPSFFKSFSSFAKSNIGILVFFGLLTTAIYGQCLQFDFVSYDDDYHVYNNLSVRDFSPASFLEILSGKTRVIGDAQAQIYANRIYIPITFISFQIHHALTGLNPLWFHAGNLLLFTLIVISIYHLLLFWLKNKPAAFACALLFAVHPLNAEPVAWITGRKDLLCDLFFIQGLLFYGNYAAKPRIKTFILALLCCLISTLSKPSGGIFIAVLFVYDFCFRNPLAWKRFLTEKLLFLIPILLPVFHSVTHYALKDNASIALDRILFSAGIPLFTLGHAFLPFALSAFYPYPQPLEWTWQQIALMAIGASGLITLWRLAKTELQLRIFGTVLFLLTLLPYGLRAAFFTDGGFTSDRYMLLPLAGLLLLLGIVLKKWIYISVQWKPLGRTMVLLLGLGVLSSLAWAAHHRAAVWKNSETLALDIIRKYPNAANAQEELGRISQQQGRRMEAAAHFKAAYLADPSSRRLIQLYELFGLNQPLISLYQKALEKNPSDSRMYAGLGMVYFRIKQFVMAEEYLQVALKNDSYNHSLYNVLAGAFYYQNRIPEAIASWQKALAIDPNYADAANNLGAAYLAQGKKEEARALFEKVLALNPQHPIARRNLEKLARAPETNL